MTDKEFKRLSRSQLIDIIYQFQLRQTELEEDNRKLAAELGDKRLRLEKAGNIADAALAVHNVLQSAQDAAEHYTEEIMTRLSEERQKILDAARAEADRIIAGAKDEAARIIGQARESASE
jgi:cell division septum initiation protein DivIVA